MGLLTKSNGIHKLGGRGDDLLGRLGAFPELMGGLRGGVVVELEGMGVLGGGVAPPPVEGEAYLGGEGGDVVCWECMGKELREGRVRGRSAWCLLKSILQCLF